MKYRKFGNHRIVTHLELCEEDFRLLLGLLRGIGFKGLIIEEAVDPKDCIFAIRDNEGLWTCLKNEDAPGLCPGADLCPYDLVKRRHEREG